MSIVDPSPPHAATKTTTTDSLVPNTFAEHVEIELANAIVLYANYKHYHGAMCGPVVQDLRRRFDELALAMLATADEFAERLPAISQHVTAVLRSDRPQKATVKPFSERASTSEMIEEAYANAQIVVDEIRAAARTAAGQGDIEAFDLLCRVITIHKKHRRFFSELLKLDRAVPQLGNTRRDPMSIEKG